jgi:stage II sporulation protein D
LNTLPREDYVKGVVPREMPASWLPEALKAQAVAARTYSLAVGGHCLWPTTSPAAAFPGAFLTFESEPVFCADTRDQVYGGKSAETAATNAAVGATAGEALTYGGGIATTYFFSTSGGKTAAKADEWGGAPVPYLVSVADPYDSISPHHAWGPKDAEVDCAGTSADCVFTAAQLRSALGLSWSPADAEVTARNGSSRVASLAVSGAGVATFPGTTARVKLGLRSTWFYVGVLSVTPAHTTVTYGSWVSLSGLTRSGGTSGWGTAQLQRKRSGETGWTSIISGLPNGRWVRSVKPVITTDYRVVSGNAVGVAARVSVRTRVALSKPVAPYTRLAGTIGPARKGILVTLYRKRTDGTWALTARTSTTTGGRFSVRISRTGTYRARADAGAGFLAGTADVRVPPA